MTLSIFLVFFILLTALVLFLTGWIRMDITALLVMGSLAVTGILTPADALSGFSNPAVITIWSMFILSAALFQTGVARMISRHFLALTGDNELKMIVVIMITASVFSSFINNIGVATLMLPVVMDLARSTGKAPSRLLIPLVFGCHLGGFNTLIGTPPNLLISAALESEGYRPLRLFDFTPVGAGATLAGIVFMALAGRHLLPFRDTLRQSRRTGEDIPVSYALEERAFFLKISAQSHLVGKTLAQSRLRAALGLNVLSIVRQDTILPNPSPELRLEPNDKLFVLGRIDDVKAMKKWQILLPVKKDMPGIRKILQKDLGIYEAVVAAGSSLPGTNLLEKDFTNRLNINLLAVKHQGKVRRSRLREYRFRTDDTLLLQGDIAQLAIFEKEGSISQLQKASPDNLINQYFLQEALFVMDIGEGAMPIGKETAEMEIGSALGLTIVAVFEDNDHLRPPLPYEMYGPGTRLLIKCNINDLPLVMGLKHIDLSEEKTLETQSLEMEGFELTEVVLAPRSNLEGKTLREVNFRKKYGLNVIAIWREGRAFRTNLHNIPLRFGEALLLYGKREQIEMLSDDSDLLLLTEKQQKPSRPHKALTALAIMAGVLIPVLLGWLPISISSILGVVAMVLSGCLKMEDAYRSIEWRSVFLIAGMLPLGLAMQQTGAASLVASFAIELVGPLGPWGVVAGIYLVASLSTLAIPPPAIVVILSPIALQTAASFNMSPYTVMIALAIAASSTFITPVSHAANLLIMGPGSYRFSDYTRVGIPLSLVVMITVFLLLPFFWPV